MTMVPTPVSSEMTALTGVDRRTRKVSFGSGIVYVGGAGSGGTLYAVSESAGNVLWTASVQNGDNSSPVKASSAGGVVTFYATTFSGSSETLSASVTYDSAHFAAASFSTRPETPDCIASSTSSSSSVAVNRTTRV